MNKVVLINESGTYGSVSGNGVWIGEVTSHEISDAENLIETRFLGTASRNFNQMIQGPRDVGGTISYRPQDMRFLFWAIGSTRSVSGTISTHAVQEINSDVRQSPFVSGTFNPPMSFTIEDSQQSPGTGRNYVRTINGATSNTVKLNLNQSETAMIEMDYIGQTMTLSSGTTTAVTVQSGIPYLWNQTLLTINGSNIDTAKSINFEVNNNITPPHYLNGSRTIGVPYKGNREYMVDVTMDWEGTQADMIYNEFYKGGSRFNLLLDINGDVTTTGSQHTRLVMSGCYIMDTKIPSPLEGVTEATLTIRPETVTGSEWSSTRLLRDGVYYAF